MTDRLPALRNPADHREGKRTLVIAIFSHIEVYPPSLNALYHLAPLFDEVHILVRNVWVSNWRYPANVHVIPTGNYVPLDQVGKNSLLQKVSAYFTFGSALRDLCRKESPAMVLLYDAAAFALFHLFARSATGKRKPVVWYHNHDVSVEEEVGRFSLMRLMKKLEIRYFHRADIFSLPNQVRLKYFPVDSLKSAPIIVPNYPSHFFFGKWRTSSLTPGGNIRLIFQGHISPSNRIEKFVQILTETISGRRMELHLAGPIHQSYHGTLIELAEKLTVRDRLFLYGRLPYGQLPGLTSSCHIGLAIYGDHNTMVRTMSTASNKIFEYASVGLPVIINFRNDLYAEFNGYPWIHFADENLNSLKDVLETIIGDYSVFSMMARRDFEKELNFELVFSQLAETVKRKLDV